MNLTAFLLAALVSEITPGPNLGYLAILAATRGRRIALAAVAGVALGLTVNMLAAALGVAALVIANPAVFEALRWAGVAFLLYLAWESWQGSSSREEGPEALPAAFVRGLLTNLLNPKAAIFYVAVLPRFMDAGAPTLPQSLTLGGLHVALATAVHCAIVLFAARSRQFFENSAMERAVRRALALALAALAIWLLFETLPEAPFVRSSPT